MGVATDSYHLVDGEYPRSKFPMEAPRLQLHQQPAGPGQPSHLHLDTFGLWQGAQESGRGLYPQATVRGE